MAKLQILNGIVVDHTEDGWAEFKKWIDGTYASLRYTWVDEGLAYALVAIDGRAYRTFNINKTDATDFETNYKTNVPFELRAATGAQMIRLDSPSEPDGKPVVVMAPFTEGLYLFASGRGDLLDQYGTIYRGEGDKLYLSWTDNDGTETKEGVITFHTTVEMHDGHIDFDPTQWGFNDEFSVVIRIPATPVTPNGSMTGNCNLVAAQEMAPWDSGTTYNPGDFVTGADSVNYVCIQGHTNYQPPNASYWLNMINVIVPAANDGYYDVDYGEAIAIPYEDSGYWDYEVWDDIFTPGTPGVSDWMLFDFQLEDIPLIKNVTCSSPLGVWDLDPYKVEPIYARWQFVFQVTRVGSASRSAAETGGYYTCFRRSA